MRRIAHALGITVDDTAWASPVWAAEFETMRCRGVVHAETATLGPLRLGRVPGVTEAPAAGPTTLLSCGRLVCRRSGSAVNRNSRFCERVSTL